VNTFFAELVNWDFAESNFIVAAAEFAAEMGEADEL
jgi:hypothetical protein